MEENKKPTRKYYDLMIGTILILLGSFRLYNRIKQNSEIDFRVILTVLFIIYGVYLIFKYLKNNNKI